MHEHVAIVTGGAGNIGRGVCRALQKSGATVVSLDVDTSRSDSTALAIDCDVTDPAACAAAVDMTVSEFGGVDTLVNLAQYVVADTPVRALTDEDMRRSFDSGPTATLRMMQLCYPSMKARGGGAIVNCASDSGTSGKPGRGAYAAAKEAIRGLTKVTAVEWGRDNVRVNVICPFASSDADQEWVRRKVAGTPLGRVGDPETDVGSLVVFLAGPGAFITGRTLFVDGGFGSWR